MVVELEHRLKDGAPLHRAAHAPLPADPGEFVEPPQPRRVIHDEAPAAIGRTWSALNDNLCLLKQIVNKMSLDLKNLTGV
jgi:hypothetical protein